MPRWIVLCCADTPIISDPRQAIARTYASARWFRFRTSAFAASISARLHGISKSSIRAESLNRREMVRRLKHPPAIGALPFEHRARIMQGVGQNVDLGGAPIDHMAVH